MTADRRNRLLVTKNHIREEEDMTAGTEGIVAAGAKTNGDRAVVPCLVLILLEYLAARLLHEEESIVSLLLEDMAILLPEIILTRETIRSMLVQRAEKTNTIMLHLLHTMDTKGYRRCQTRSTLQLKSLFRRFRCPPA